MLNGRGSAPAVRDVRCEPPSNRTTGTGAVMRAWLAPCLASAGTTWQSLGVWLPVDGDKLLAALSS